MVNRVREKKIWNSKPVQVPSKSTKSDATYQDVEWIILSDGAKFGISILIPLPQSPTKQPNWTNWLSE